MMKLDVYIPGRICYSLSFVTGDGDPSAFAGHGDAFGLAGTERRRPKVLAGAGAKDSPEVAGKQAAPLRALLK